MERAQRATIAFSLFWKSRYAEHQENISLDKTDFYRDILPPGTDAVLPGLGPGESCSHSFISGVLVPPYQEKKVYTFNKKLLDLQQGAKTITPHTGRFYPRGIAWRGLNSFKQDTTPFRLIDIQDSTVVADTNHPLAEFPLTLRATCIKIGTSVEEHGGVCNDIAELVTENGPGMQIHHENAETDFYSPYPFPRQNEEDDSVFYQPPRLVSHLDAVARKQVIGLHEQCLVSGMNILDLMSSWESHIPISLDNCRVTGLGLNRDELIANPRLTKTLVHDLNRDPKLPFDDNTFDATICTASIEYLIRPIEVMAEVARVTRPGGISVTTFSDRWFPGKQILSWQDMHPFERLGFVLDLYLQTGAFEALHTKSIRGLPRPFDDPHIYQTRQSDPIYAVWGRVRG